MTNITDALPIRSREEDYINIQPIQAAGRLTLEARKAIISYGDGYSTCDFCFKPFRLDKIQKPPIGAFYEELAKFVNMDQARVVRGARNAFQIVANSLLDKGDVALVSSLAHYSLCLAIESAGAVWKEVPLDENHIITADAVERKIEELKPKLVAIHHVDYLYGNLHPVAEIGKVCHEHDVPFLYNGAYTVGTMPVDGKKLNADFIVGSGHKSMASAAPSGVLATTEEYAQKVFRTTSLKGDITGRKFGIKETELLGCTVMGAPLISMIASFPKVKERVKHWDDEVKKVNYFMDEFLKVKGSRVLSEMPRKHTLTKVDTSDSFNKVAEGHRKRGYFLSSALEGRGILGPFPGATMEWKLNTYGLNWDQIKHLSESFKEIARENGMEVA
ncbi:MAG: O-phospho-L-seryl-tRNA:Cys-tRNA synthase [Candidatus Altiarchaeota archaeon]